MKQNCAWGCDHDDVRRDVWQAMMSEEIVIVFVYFRARKIDNNMGVWWVRLEKLR